MRAIHNVWTGAAERMLDRFEGIGTSARRNGGDSPIERVPVLGCDCLNRLRTKTCRI